MNTYHDCQTCIDYMKRRSPVVLPEMVRVSRVTNETSEQILGRYMTGVHARHLAGGSL